MDISENVVRWLANGERGISSNTIVQVLVGLPCVGTWGGSHPHDPDDLTRCIRLLEECPELTPLFPRMEHASKEWGVLVPAWPELSALLDSELPNWRGHEWGNAPKTYGRMRELLDSVST